MLKNNCQCELCQSVWGAGVREDGPVVAEGKRPVVKRRSAVGSGLATQAVALVLLICGVWLMAARIPDGMWYTVPSAVFVAVISAFPIAHTGIAILDSLEKLYENNC